MDGKRRKSRSKLARSPVPRPCLPLLGGLLLLFPLATVKGSSLPKSKGVGRSWLLAIPIRVWRRSSLIKPTSGHQLAHVPETLSSSETKPNCSLVTPPSISHEQSTR